MVLSGYGNKIYFATQGANQRVVTVTLYDGTAVIVMNDSEGCTRVEQSVPGRSQSAVRSPRLSAS